MLFRKNDQGMLETGKEIICIKGSDLMTSGTNPLVLAKDCVTAYRHENNEKIQL